MVWLFSQKLITLKEALVVKADAAIVHMDIKKKITVSWSGGKDSALALHSISKDEFEVVNLHTVIDHTTKRVGLHGVHETLIEEQALKMGLPLVKGYLNENKPGSYPDLVREIYQELSLQGITHILFGDIFLEDLRHYREGLLVESGLTPVYPLWRQKPSSLILRFVDAKFKTVICAANDKCYEAGLLGSEIDRDFSDRLPEGVDVCGENGEFHSFVFDGPFFSSPISYTLGSVVSKNYNYAVTVANSIESRQSEFYFQDILPAR